MANNTKSRRHSRKALIWRILTVITCAMILAQGFAMSEQTTPPLRHILEIKVAVKPEEMVAPGDVTLTWTIENTSEYDANDLSIASSDGLHSESIGQLAAGDPPLTFTRPYTVTQAELDAGEIAFVVSHDDIADDETPVNYPVKAKITRSEAKPDIEFTRQVSARAVVQDSAVTVTYRLKNTGNVPLTQIRVRDSLDEITWRIESLEPGATWVRSNRVSIGKTTVSAASVSYVAEAVSDDARTKELDEAEIRVVEEALTASLTLDRDAAAVGDTLNGVLTIAAGGVGLSGISVTDDVYGTVLADALELKAGATITLTCSWPVREPSDYRIRVTGIAETGNRIEAVTNTEHAQLTAAFTERALKITAVAATPIISRPGGVRVMVKIENTGGTVARDVTLTEATKGEIRTFAFIPAGEPTYRDVICDVKDDARFVFAVAYEDDAGNRVTEMSEPVEIRVASGGALPEVASAEDGGFVGWISRNVDDSITYIWMLGIAGAALIILTVVLITSHFRERKARRQKLDKEKQRRREEMGRTTKFEPVKRPGKPKKRGGTDV